MRLGDSEGVGIGEVCGYTCSSHGVLTGPLLGSGLIFSTVRLVDLGDLRHERILGVGIGQQGADGEEDLGDGQSWGPLILQDIQAD